LNPKPLIATFTLAADRKDGYGVSGEDGGKGDASQKLYRLKEVNLYTKADYAKNVSMPVPSKRCILNTAMNYAKRIRGMYRPIAESLR